jgi:hypothetical protein
MEHKIKKLIKVLITLKNTSLQWGKKKFNQNINTKKLNQETKPK